MKPNCRQCKHFFITHDKFTPYGCKKYGIKSAKIPSMVVKNANDGAECLGFAPKAVTKDRPKDLNDPSLW